MKRTIHLVGPLEKLQKEIILDVDSPRELMAGLRSQIPNFEQELRKLKGVYIVIGKEGKEKIDPAIENNLAFNFGDNTDIFVVPGVKGDWAAAIWAAGYIGATGMALYVVAAVIYVAIMIAVSYVAQALAPKPDAAGGSASVESRPSRIFNGAINVVEQGYSVPLIYGLCLCGSTVMSVYPKIGKLI